MVIGRLTISIYLSKWRNTYTHICAYLCVIIPQTTSYIIKEASEAFSVKSGIRQWHVFLALLFKIVLAVLASTIK